MKIYLKIDKIFKILFLIFAQIAIVFITISLIIFIGLSKSDIEKIENNEMMKNFLLNMKMQANILIWFMAPLTIYILGNNIYKLYDWLHNKRITNKKNNRKKS